MYYFANFMTVEKEKREAIYRAFDSFQEILKKGDYGHCDECGWKILSSESTKNADLEENAG